MIIKGAIEFSGLYGLPSEATYRMFRQWNSTNKTRTPNIIYSDPVTFTHGLAVTDFILKENLGTVVKSLTVTNPNSRRRLDIFVFSPNKKNFTKWGKKITRELEIEAKKRIKEREKRLALRVYSQTCG